MEDGCLLWGGQMIVSKSLKDVMMAELHKHHLGISKMNIGKVMCGMCSC